MYYLFITHSISGRCTLEVKDKVTNRDKGYHFFFHWLPPLLWLGRPLVRPAVEPDEEEVHGSDDEDSSDQRQNQPRENDEDVTQALLLFKQARQRGKKKAVAKKLGRIYKGT